MKLFYREYGSENTPTLVILHGLLGSSRNWHAAAMALSSRFHVYCIDSRNHGGSPHEAPHSYEAMVGDLSEWMDDREIDRCFLMGHSMGGKVAMKLACENPDRVEKLIVVDIAPKLYPNSHDRDYEAMRSLSLGELSNRKEADRAMEALVPDWAMRQFIITNLVRNESGDGYRWQVNLDAIMESQPELENTPLGPSQRFDGETLFIVGGKSRYFLDEDRDLVERHFVSASFSKIDESGHNPHFECKERFVEIVESFALPAG